MKILLLTSHLEIGGISNYIVWLAEGLRQEGHDVLVASGGGELVGDLKQSGIIHFKVNLKIKNELSPSLFQTISDLVKIVKREGIEVIHSQTRISQVAADYVSKLTGVPYVTTCHGLYKRKLFRRFFPCWGQRIIAISEPVRAHLVNCFNIPKQNTRLIHNGLDISRFSRSYTPKEKKDIKQRYGLKDQGKVVGNIARLVSVKGQNYLLYAAREVLKVRPKTQFLIIGDGETKQELVDLAEKLDISQSVFFPGAIKEVGPVLAIMDVFAFPAVWQEGFGLSVLEAMTAGLPVVASNVGGIYTLIKDRRNGLLIPPRDVPSLIDALLRLLDDKKLAVKMGEEGHHLAAKKFSLDKVVKQIADVYREVVH